jgi:hypothetical protein
MITKEITAEKIASYLHHEISLPELVDWAENAIMEGEFPDADAAILAQVIGRLGVADVKAFGLAWDDCADMLKKLGYAAKVEVVRS